MSDPGRLLAGDIQAPTRGHILVTPAHLRLVQLRSHTKPLFKVDHQKEGKGYAKVEETIPQEESFVSACQLMEQKAGETCADIKSFAGENRSRRPYTPDLGVGCGKT